MLLFDRPRQHDDVARAMRHQHEPALSSRSTSATGRSAARSRPISTRNRARCDSSASFATERASDERVSRYVAGPRFAERARQREQHRTLCERDRRCLPSRTTCRHASTTNAFDASSASTSSSSRIARRHGDQARSRRVQSAARVSTSAVNAGILRVARGAFGAGERGARRLRPQTPHRDPGDTSSCDGLQRGRQAARGRVPRAPARPRRCVRSAAAAAPRDTARAPRSRWSPCASSVARAASSAFAGQPRSRETSAISASATMHRARAMASCGPNARAARRSSAFALTRSPSCAIAMPRSASAGASSRSATRFSAPSGSPAASARAAAVISESIEIPSHLSLPPFGAGD